MTYDLAVWEGPKPADNARAATEYERRMDAMEEALAAREDTPAPTPAIQAFLGAALARFPELNQDSGRDCPWATAPLKDEAIGDLICFPMTFSGAEYARDPLAEIADSLGWSASTLKSSNCCRTPTRRPPQRLPPSPTKRSRATPLERRAGAGRTGSRDYSAGADQPPSANSDGRATIVAVETRRTGEVRARTEGARAGLRRTLCERGAPW